MPSSGMLHRVTLVRTDVSEEHIASIIRVKRIEEVGTLAVTSNRITLQEILYYYYCYVYYYYCYYYCYYYYYYCYCYC
jgi:hypothetical protein